MPVLYPNQRHMKSTSLFFLAVLLIAFTSCTETNNSIIGKWKKDTMYLTVNDNGTQRGEYEIPGDPTHTHYDVTGNYTINGSTFTFVNLAGTSSCPYGDTGVYTFTVNNNILNLVLVSDQCTGRGNFMPGDYTRQ